MMIPQVVGFVIRRASNHHLLQCVGPRDFCWAMTVKTSGGSRRRPSEPSENSASYAESQYV